MLRFVSMTALCLCVLGCQQGHHGHQHEAKKVDEGPIAVSADATAKMAAADAYDGQTDHVVAKCPACSLQMDGKPDFGIQLGDYKLQFCSNDCRKSYSRDPEDKLSLLKVPEPVSAE